MDAADNVTQVIDAIGNDIDDTFNANGWRTARAVTRASGVIDTTTETYTFDGLGRLTSAADDDYKVEFTYGVIGLSSMPYEETQSYVGGTAYAKSVTKTYDAVGNKVSELYPSGLDLDYTWNSINAMATVTDGTSTIATFAYIGSRPKTVTYQNGTTVNYGWLGYRGEVAGISHKDSSTAVLVNPQYGYDANHDRLYERFGSSGSSGEGFAYDKARRLTTAWMGSSTPSNPTSAAYVKKIDYLMDDDGNRSSVVVTPYGQSPGTTTYTDNALNQYTAVGGVNQAHDGNGNLKDDGTYLYEYSYRSLLCRVKLKSDNSTVATYKHDALGRRVEKEVGSPRERYIYSGFETVSVYDSTNTWVRDFVFGQGIDAPLMLRQADVTDFDGDTDTSEVTRHFYHRNALGSVMLLTDMNEAEGASYRYEPYGAVTITVGGTPQSDDPLGNPFMFTSRFQDEETGLMYYRARAYSSAMGRFLQRDPLGYGPGPNVYEYCRSAPGTLRDPLGLEPKNEPKGGPAIGGPEGPGSAGHGSRGESSAGDGHLGYGYSWYVWTPESATTQTAVGLWARSTVTVTYTNLGRKPDGAPAPDLPPMVTVEYWRMGSRRSKRADTHEHQIPSDYCRGRVTIHFHLQFGTLLVDYGNGHEPPPGSVNHVTESANYDGRSGSNKPIGSAAIQFTPVGPATEWSYSWEWDACNCTVGKSRREWSTKVRPKPHDVTPPPAPPPPVTTPSTPG